jgi:uncharacterized membrane protein YfcA|tara:strand:+ start:396 stop:833 length:438 start_codon:yes stop_codon:yes gene_type:complete
MFGLPMEMLTMLISTVGGAVMKMWSQTSADKAEQQKALITRFQESEKSVESARAFVNPNANWIRRFLVISFMAMAGFILIAPALFNVTTQIPVISTEGFKLLFLDFTKDITTWIELEGIVTPDWLGHAILSVVGMYFGSSITSRR